MKLDLQKINELLTRGVENIYPNKDFLEKLLKSGKKLTLYTGYDPTTPTLHIGHGITLLKLRQFQELGHKIIFLIGDFTGMIGDPTDKSSARQKLTKKQVQDNYKLYKKQASSVLNFSGKNAVEVRYNSEWADKLSSRDLLELASHVTVPRLLERDMFQERLKEGKTIHLHEFLYPLFQGYDSVDMNVDGEVGGNDQTFNMLVGRDLLKELKGKEKFVLTMKLLTDAGGKKMGKTEGNMVALSDTPEDMFGKVMSWDDEMIRSGFELCTNVPMDEIQSIMSAKNPRDAKVRLAFGITKTFLGEKAAKKGQEYFIHTFSKKEQPDDMPSVKPTHYDIVTVLVESKLSSSKGDARRAIEQGGVKVNDAKVSSYDAAVKKGDVVQKGKRFFVKIT